jgi:hypothetical protein
MDTLLPNNEAPATGKSRVSSKTNVNNGGQMVADVPQKRKCKTVVFDHDRRGEIANWFEQLKGQLPAAALKIVESASHDKLPKTGGVYYHRGRAASDSGLSVKKKRQSAPTLFGLRLRGNRLLVPCSCGDVHSYFYSASTGRKALRFAHCANPKRQQYYIGAADYGDQRKRVKRVLAKGTGWTGFFIPTPLEQLTPEARAEEKQLREGGAR